MVVRTGPTAWCLLILYAGIGALKLLVPPAVCGTILTINSLCRYRSIETPITGIDFLTFLCLLILYAGIGALKQQHLY